jgi:hypothetical protein
MAAIQNPGLYDVEETEVLSEDERRIKSFILSYSDAEEAKWIGVAAIEAFSAGPSTY